jgi:hypothetical protein
MGSGILEMRRVDASRVLSLFDFCAYVTQYVPKETQTIDEMLPFVSFNTCT